MISFKIKIVIVIKSYGLTMFIVYLIIQSLNVLNVFLFVLIYKILGFLM